MTTRFVDYTERGDFITTNQVAFNSLLEAQRHNKVTEAETYRNNVAVLTEANRHNLATERLGRDTLIETNRHNVATEANQRYSADMSYAAAKYAADRSYAASAYSANMHYAATKYSADSGYAANKYSSNMSYSKQLAANSSAQQIKQMDIDYRTLNDNANRAQSASNTKYSADKQYGSSMAGAAGHLLSGVLSFLK